MQAPVCCMCIHRLASLLYPLVKRAKWFVATDATVSCRSCCQEVMVRHGQEDVRTSSARHCDLLECFSRCVALYFSITSNPGSARCQQKLLRHAERKTRLACAPQGTRCKPESAAVGQALGKGLLCANHGCRCGLQLH